MWLEVPGGRVKVTKHKGILHISELSVDKDAPFGTLLIMIRKLKEMTKGKTVRATVLITPDFERLTRLYMKFELEPYAVLMEKQCQA